MLMEAVWTLHPHRRHLDMNWDTTVRINLQIIISYNTKFNNKAAYLNEKNNSKASVFIIAQLRYFIFSLN